MPEVDLKYIRLSACCRFEASTSKLSGTRPALLLYRVVEVEDLCALVG